MFRLQISVRHVCISPSLKHTHPHRGPSFQDLVNSDQGHTVISMLLDVNGFWQYDNRWQISYRITFLLVCISTTHQNTQRTHSVYPLQSLPHRLLHSCIPRESLMQQSTANTEPDDDYGDYDYESGVYLYQLQLQLHFHSNMWCIIRELYSASSFPSPPPIATISSWTQWHYHFCLLSPVEVDGEKDTGSADSWSISDVIQ